MSTLRARAGALVMSDATRRALAAVGLPVKEFSDKVLGALRLDGTSRHHFATEFSQLKITRGNPVVIEAPRRGAQGQRFPGRDKILRDH